MGCKGLGCENQVCKWVVLSHSIYSIRCNWVIEKLNIFKQVSVFIRSAAFSREVPKDM